MSTDTVILFLADNGAEGMDLVHARNPRFRARAEAADNSYDNLGKDSSYISYGPGWAQAATTPTSAPESAALMRAAEALQQLHTQTSAPTPHASATVTAAHVSASAAKPAARRAPPKAPPAPAPTPVAAPAPVAEPPPPAPAPVVAARPAAPRELCAGTQFLARGLCLQTECNKPGQQKHPQCAQLREQQEAMRQGTGGG